VRHVVDGTKRDDTAPLGRSVSSALEAAAAQAMGGAICGPDAAAAAGSGRGGAATGRTATVAIASARACRYGALRGGANTGRLSAGRGAQDGGVRRVRKGKRKSDPGVA
jgi:hypothetical protein